MKPFKTLIAILLLFAISAGCGFRGSSGNEDRIKAAVLKYGRGLIEAYRDLDPSTISTVASEAQVKKVDVIITSFLQAERVMEAEMLSTAFKGVSIHDDGRQATVRTDEEWEYRWVDVNTKEVVVPLKRTRYGINYYLVLKDGVWVVDRTESMNEKTEDAAGKRGLE